MANKLFFRSNIELKDIDILINKTQKDINIEEYKEGIGRDMFLYLHKRNSDNDKGGIILDNEYMMEIKLYNDGFLPMIEILYKDPFKIIDNLLQPDDDTILSFYKKPNSDILMPVRIDFAITNLRILKEKSSDNNRIYSILGKLTYNNNTENKAYKGTSFSVLQTLAKEGELGFASNIDDTNDSMTWINPGLYTTDFINDIVKNSYIDNDSYLYSFIDLYYNLNLINVEKQLNDNTFDQKNVFSLETLYTENKDKTKAITRLILTNHQNLSSTNLFITKYVVDNSSRDISVSIGYKSQIYYYDKIDNTSHIDELNPILSEKKEQINFHSPTMKYDNNFRKYLMGKQDTDNVHSKFLYARKQNENNLDFSQVLKMKIILNSSNFNLYRFQHVEVIIYDFGTLISSDGNKLNETKPDIETELDKVNEKLSGSWLVSGINYIYRKGKVEQEITLIRKDMNISYDKEKLYDITKGFYEYKK